MTEQVKKKKQPKKKLTQEEIDDWNALYEYVRSTVMKYDINQALPPQWVLRLKGLLVNKYMENHNIKDTANYTFKTILNTFKYSMPEIRNAFQSVNFKDENHKFNLVLKIVERNINTVYVREKAVEKSKEKIEAVDTSIIEYKGAEYKPKTKDTKKKFDDLW